MWRFSSLLEVISLTFRSIVMFSQDHTEVARWNFSKGWPSKISGPSVKADGNDIGVEELTIVHEGIKRIT